MSDNAGDGVVLLHGIARSSCMMDRLQWQLAARGYRVLNLDYPSRKQPIEALIEGMRPAIEAFNKDKTGKLHFIGFSMGGIVTRGYLAKYRPANLGRVVLLGTPNKGSEVADFLKKRLNFFYRWYFGPAGQQLTTKDGFPATLSSVDYETGCIAGDRTIDPVSTLLLIKGPNDGKVSVESTKAAGMKDHIVLHATHTFMTRNMDVIDQARYFIENGVFNRPQV